MSGKVNFALEGTCSRVVDHEIRTEIRHEICTEIRHSTRACALMGKISASTMSRLRPAVTATPS
jgi:hypothetical protein